MAIQGALESAPYAGVSSATPGSDWIVRAARRNDPRPLWVLVWGGIDDLAQALHDAPDILPRLRVYFIGGPNKMWSVNAYDYIEQHHPALWMIEANSTYRGWFTGGNQSGEWGNTRFVEEHVAGRGALGQFFATLLGGTIKMGDSPSVAHLLQRAPEDPSQPGWGGRFVRVWDGRRTVFNRLTTAADTVEAFGVVEFVLPVPAGMTRAHSAQMIVDGRIPAVGASDGRVLRFRFSPRDARVWPYVIRSDFPGLDGQSGQFTAVLRARDPAVARAPSLVDRRSGSGRGRRRSRGSEARQPLARSVPAGLRRSPGSVQPPGGSRCTTVAAGQARSSLARGFTSDGLRLRQGDAEDGAALGGVVRADCAAVRRHDAAHDAESQSEAVGLGRDERFEQPSVQLHGDTGAGVANGNFDDRSPQRGLDQDPPVC